MQANNDVPGAAAKRTVPWKVLLHLVLSGRLLQLGLIPFLAGFAFVACCKPVLISAVALRGHILAAQGHVYLSQDTGATAGSLPVYENRYTYVTPDGITRRGVSYGHAEDPTGAAPVIVLYSAPKPSISVIAGMKGSKWSPLIAALTAIPLVVGLVLVIAGIIETYHIYQVLVSGTVGTAYLTDKVQTKREINRHPIYQYKYDFTFPSGNVKKESLHTLEWLHDSQPFLYRTDPKEFGALLVALPGRLNLINGKYSATSGLMQSMIIPIIAVATSVGIFVALK